MPDYDFHTLSPYDFELISRDIIQARDNIVLESFRTGRDGGIDFRYCPSEDQKIIVQCKHYRGTSVSGLIRSLKKEAQKLIKLSPSRYIIVTSLPLSPSNKDLIRKIFPPDLLGTNDIITADDLNNLLVLYPKIETSHYKLWLSSVSVMQRVFHNAEHSRAEFEMEEISKRLKLYVHSDAYSEALNILGNEKFVIISGQPGVGKTTLAEMLVYAHVERGYRPIIINGSIEEARNLYSAEEKQIFYYDDFLGATFLGEQSSFLGNNNDRDLLRFIEMVRRSKSARFILTTREHILRQALHVSERLSTGNILGSKCVIEVSSYKRPQKAHMLYNHVYFSNLPKEYIAVILTNNLYLRIIDHPKFNPRVIEWLSSYHRIRDIPPDGFGAFIIGLLTDPAQIWLHAYHYQISDSARSMLLAIHSLGPFASIEVVFEAFDKLNRYRSKKYNYSTKPTDQRLAAGEICDSFVTSTKGTFAYINPSVADLMNRIIRETPDNGLDIIYSAEKFSQLLKVLSIAEAVGGEHLKAHICKNIIAITPTLRYLIERPVFEKRGNEIISRDAGIDERSIGLLKIADFCATAEVLSLLAMMLEKVLQGLQDGSLSVRDGLDVYRRMLACKFIKTTSIRGFITRFKATMLKALQENPTIDELVAAIQHTEDEDDWKNDMWALRRRSEGYVKHNFSDELDVCTDASECSDLHISLEYIATFFDLDLSRQLECIREKEEEIQQKMEALTEEIGGFHSSQNSVAQYIPDEVTSMFETLSFTPDKA